MAKDYLVHADDHSIEYSFDNLREAKKEATRLYSNGSGRNDVTIDEYVNNELTGIYWYYYKGKLLKIL